jgi:hypothetical protein
MTKLDSVQSGTGDILIAATIAEAGHMLRALVRALRTSDSADELEVLVSLALFLRDSLGEPIHVPSVEELKPRRSPTAA